MANLGKLLENSALSSATGGLSTIFNLVGAFGMNSGNPVVDPYAGRLNQQIAGEYQKDRIDKKYGVNTAPDQLSLSKALASDPTYLSLEEQLAASEVPYMGVKGSDDSSWYNYVTPTGQAVKNPQTFLNDLGITSLAGIQPGNTQGLPSSTASSNNLFTSNSSGNSSTLATSINQNNNSSNSSLGSILASGGIGGLLSLLSSGSTGGGGQMANSSGVDLSSIFATPFGSGNNTSTGSSGSSGTGSSTFGSIAQLLQGGLGLYEANQLGQNSNQAASVSNPFGPYRQMYAQQLNDLMNNPKSLQDDPSYQAGIQAVQRGAASSGLLGSGKEAVDLLQYGGNLFDSAVTQLAQLAGAGINPGTAGQLMQQGGVNQANMTGQALNSLQYAGQQLFQNSTGAGSTQDSGLLSSLGSYGNSGVDAGQLGTGFSSGAFTPDTGGVSAGLGSGFFNAGSSGGFDFSSFGY